MLIFIVLILSNGWTVVLIELLGYLLSVLGTVEPMLALSFAHGNLIKYKDSIVIVVILVFIRLIF